MLSLDQIKALNVEMSSHCNGKCPFCSRDQKIRPYPGHMLKLDDFQQLPTSLIEQLKWVNFGGNFGDFSTNPDMISVCRYLKTLNPELVLGGDTNGSVQGKSFWQQLGTYFKNGSMVFSVDGLSDTHALHRIGTNYQKIIENINAFTSSGGVAHWKFIVFAHNEHQIDRACDMAKQIGCKRFFVTPSRDYNDSLKQPTGFSFEIKRQIYKSYDDKAVQNNEKASCKPLSNGSLYIAADGTIHPCCFAHCMYITEHNSAFDFLPPLADKYYDQINIKRTPIQEIIAGDYFSEILEKSTSNDYCRMKCNPFRKMIKKELILKDEYFS